MGVELDALVVSWRRSLRAQNKAAKTLTTYVASVEQLAAHLDGEGVETVADIRGRHVEGWIADLLETRSPATASVRFRAAQQFFKWCEGEEEIVPNPMAKLRPPAVPEKQVPLVSEEEMRAILKTCDKSFVGRRDEAVLRVLYDGGLRIAECAGLAIYDLDLDSAPAAVFVRSGKGGRSRTVAVGLKTEEALDRYLRVRRREKRAAELDALWLGDNGRGAMTVNGLAWRVRARGRKVGLEIHPHMLRHSLAHEARVAGMDDDSLMRTMGWSSRSMLSRYGSSAAEARARAARGRLQLPGDRI